MNIFTQSALAALLFAGNCQCSVTLQNEQPRSATRRQVCRQAFTADENSLLRQLVDPLGYNNWTVIASNFQNRTSRQCKFHWNHFLAPNFNFSPFSSEEDKLLVDLVAKNGPKWTTLSVLFPGRTDASLKNRYHLLGCKRAKFLTESLTSSHSDTETEDVDPVAPGASTLTYTGDDLSEGFDDWTF
ncbi:MAG: hypothetical protein LBJ89_01390 [Holosporales bacterium]|nr:hypothetical protein [Holosporales bacterium]